MGYTDMNNLTSNPTSPISNSITRFCDLLHFNNKQDSIGMRTIPTGNSTTIRVSFETKDRLDHLALHRKETYENILVRLLEKN